MSKKPTYKELEQRVKGLKLEIDMLKGSGLEPASKDTLRQYEYIVSSSTDMLALLDKQFRYLATNKAYMEAFELTPEQLIGNSMAKVFGKDFFNTVIKPNADRCLSGKKINYQDWFDFPKHGRRYMDINYYPYYDWDNKIMGFVVNGRNITERKHIEEELQESKDKFSKAFHANPSMISISRLENGEYLEVNDTFEHKTGFTRKEIIGRTSTELGLLSNPHDRKKLKQILEEYGALFHQEFALRIKSGKILKTIVSAETIEIKGEKCLISSLEDITERKQAEEALLNEKLLSEEYINSLPGLFYVFDEHRLVRWNSEWNRITGYSNEELVSKYGTDFFEGKDKTLIGERMLKVFRDGVSEAEAELVTKDGERIPYYFTGLRKKLKGKNHLIGLGIDITERRRAEEEKQRLQNQLQQSYKIEAIGTLAGGIAHKFNNSLSGITGNIELLKMANPDSKIIDKFTDRMLTSARNMSNLSNQLLAYAEGGKYQPKALSLPDLIDSTFPIINRKVAPAIQVDTDIPLNIFNIKGDQTQIQMLISAIIDNAAESIENKGRIRIIIRNEGVDKKFVKKHPDLKTGSYVCIKIIDDGKGMDEETKQRIFEPFFTTNFQGRGLGMAATYGIVKNHNGCISVDSEPGKGTMVSIYLPAVDIRIEKAEEPKAEIHMGAGTILLIEDEEMVMEVGRSMLEKLGYSVLAAECGKEAINIAKTFNGNIDLALLDMGLPDIGGKELYPLLMEVRPKLKVIICSGYSIDGPARDVLDAGAQAFIQKPFLFAELSAKLKQTIERRKYKRFKVKKDAVAIFKSNPPRQGQIIDISESGLAFRYAESSPLSIGVNESDELAINWIEENFCLDNVPCKTISYSTLADDAPLGSTAMKRHGLQFGELSQNHTDQLKHFIENHTS